MKMSPNSCACASRSPSPLLTKRRDFAQVLQHTLRHAATRCNTHCNTQIDEHQRRCRQADAHAPADRAPKGAISRRCVSLHLHRGLFSYVYVCIYIYVYIYIYVCVSLFVSLSLFSYVYMYA